MTGWPVAQDGVDLGVRGVGLEGGDDVLEDGCIRLYGTYPNETVHSVCRQVIELGIMVIAGDQSHGIWDDHSGKVNGRTGNFSFVKQSAKSHF